MPNHLLFAPWCEKSRIPVLIFKWCLHTFARFFSNIHCRRRIALAFPTRKRFTAFKINESLDNLSNIVWENMNTFCLIHLRSLSLYSAIKNECWCRMRSRSKILWRLHSLKIITAKRICKNNIVGSLLNEALAFCTEHLHACREFSFLTRSIASKQINSCKTMQPSHTTNFVER